MTKLVTYILMSLRLASDALKEAFADAAARIDFNNLIFLLLFFKLLRFYDKYSDITFFLYQKTIKGL